jgi:hypothetical protein
MKTKYTLFRRGGIYYSQDSATGQQKSLRTRDEAEALKLINARNEAHRQPVLNLHLARAYMTASDPAFVERTWQIVMAQLQARGQESSRERYASVFKSPSFDGLRNKRLMETTADDFLTVFKDGKVSIVYFLKRLHNFALSLGWIALPVVGWDWAMSRRPARSWKKSRRNSAPIRRCSPSNLIFMPKPGSGMRRRKLPGRSPDWNQSNRAHGFRWRMRPGGSPAGEFPKPGRF